MVLSEQSDTRCFWKHWNTCHCALIYSKVKYMRTSVTYRSTMQALIVQQVLLQDRLLTGQLLFSHLLQRRTQLIV